MRAELVLSAILIYLYLYFAVENIYTALSPLFGIAELREKTSCANHSLGFEKEVVTLL